jgi:site-specific DNA recombinase
MAVTQSYSSGTAGDPRQRTGREYLRNSKLKQASVDEQHEDNLTKAQERGVALGTPYALVEKDGSASRYAQQDREGFQRLLHDLANHKQYFREDELWLWESSRGSRQVGEWSYLLDLCEQARKDVWVTSHNRLYNPRVPRDRKSLQEDAVDSEYDTAKLSLRLRRSSASRAARGLWHGGAGFGYCHVRDASGQITAKVLVEDEAAVMRRMFHHVLGGGVVLHLARELEADGVRTRAGKLWTPALIGNYLRNPVYAGLRNYDQGRQDLAPKERWNKDNRLRPDSKPVPGVWEPVVSPEIFYEVQRLLGRSRRGHNGGRLSGAATYWLSMIGLCDKCGGPLVGRHPTGRQRNYACRTATHASVAEADLDRLVEHVLLFHLARDDDYLALRRRDAAAVDQELAAKQREIKALETQLDELAESVRQARGEGIHAARFAVITAAGIEEDIAKARAQEHQLLLGDSRRQAFNLLEPGPDVELRWRALKLPARRIVAATLFTPAELGAVRLMPRPANRRGKAYVPVSERVRFQTDEDTAPADRP